VLYVSFLSNDWVYYRRYVKAVSEVWVYQVWYVPLALAASAIVVVLGYLALRCDGILGICVPLRDNCMSEGMSFRFPILVCIGVYFCLVNPVLEEWFWRLFLYRELGGALFLQRPPPLASEDQHLQRSDSDEEACRQVTSEVRMASDKDVPGPVFLLHRHTEARPVTDTLDIRLTILGQVVVSFLYATYHFIVVFHLMGVTWAFLAVVALTFLGWLWIAFRNNQRFGLVTAIGSHCGIDVGVALAIAIAMLGFH